MNKTETQNLKTGLTAVSADDFASVKTHPDLLRQVVIGLQANRHHSNADTQTRGEVSGGGRKPWRQKGTGRARVGSSRTPLWRGGGIVFGPSNNRNFSHVISIKFKAQAMLTALAMKAQTGSLHISDLGAAPTTTKAALAALPEVLEFSKVLLVVPDNTYFKAFQNIEHVYLVEVNQLNVLNIANAAHIIFVGGTYAQLKAKVLK